MFHTSKRVRFSYPRKVPVPESMKQYLWDNEGVAALEKIILRVLLYGKFEDIKKIYSMYSRETGDIACKYPEIKRGVRFWINRWNNG